MEIPARRFQCGGASAQVLSPWNSAYGRALKVGLSGGIGSGKTTVARTWASLGVRVVSADEIAREVTAPGSVGLRTVVDRFGVQILDKDGELNRQKLARITFSSPQNRKDLEDITHPLIASRVQTLVESAAADSVFVYEVPLLVEKGMAADFDCVVMITADESTRLDRLASRGMSIPDAQARMGVQATVAQRLAVSNIWVENHGTPTQLGETAKAVHGWLAGSHASG